MARGRVGCDDHFYGHDCGRGEEMEVKEHEVTQLPLLVPLLRSWDQRQTSLPTSTLPRGGADWSLMARLGQWVGVTVGHGALVAEMTPAIVH
jgi:hypothetical protein